MNATTSRILATGAFVLAAFSQVGATDCGQVINDDGFDLWCGTQLCDWQIDKGSIEKVQTWHVGDDGVQFNGDGAEISQLSSVTSHDGACLQFDVLADIDPTVDMELFGDIWGDGNAPEYQQRIIGSGFAPLVFSFKINGYYNGIRFYLQKHGDGHATLAQLRATVIDCTDVGQVVDAGVAPLGGGCDFTNNAMTCNGGGEVCQAISRYDGLFEFAASCSSCSGSFDDNQIWSDTCSGGSVCGWNEPTAADLQPYAACIPQGSKQLGESCLSSGECATAICSPDGHTCSTCDDTGDATCLSGEACTRLTYSHFRGPSASECAPGQHHRTTGEECVLDDDCASPLACHGTPASHCSDGRSCAADADCPEVFDINYNLVPDTCTSIGVVGGTCL